MTKPDAMRLTDIIGVAAITAQLRSRLPLEVLAFGVALSLSGCSSTPVMVALAPMPQVASGPPIPSPPGGGCLPFESLVPPGPRPETARFADILFRAGYVIVRVEYGHTEWRCGRARTSFTPNERLAAKIRVPVLVQDARPSPASPPVLAKPMPSAPQEELVSRAPSAVMPPPRLRAAPAPREASPAPPQAEARTVVERLLPGNVSERKSWAADIADAYRALGIPAIPESVCMTIAVIGQESGFQVDPVVPSLPQVAWRELERRRERTGLPRLVLDAAVALRSPNGHTYKERLDTVRTERQLSAIFDDFVAVVPLGAKLLDRYNPIHTVGPMQVSVDFISEYARQRPTYLQGQATNLRAVGFSRPGGIYFGTAHLVDYHAPYDDPVYRFADYNAGRYASRNAALQNALATLSGISLKPDGALIRRDDDSLTDTARAALALGPRLGLDQDRILNALRQQRSEAMQNTELYRRVFELADRRAGVPLPRAVIPQIKLTGPKIQRNYLSTAWFARRVQSRYDACLKRGAAVAEMAQR